MKLANQPLKASVTIPPSSDVFWDYFGFWPASLPVPNFGYWTDFYEPPPPLITMFGIFPTIKTAGHRVRQRRVARSDNSTNEEQFPENGVTAGRESFPSPRRCGNILPLRPWPWRGCLDAEIDLIDVSITARQCCDSCYDGDVWQPHYWH